MGKATIHQQSFFPLTLRGIILGLFSLFFLIQGVIRADLAGMFWGTGFLVLVLAALIANLLYLQVLKRAHQKKRIMADLKLASEGIFPGEVSPAHFKIELPGFAMPGLTLLAQIKLYWQDRAPILLKSPLSFGSNRFTLDFKAFHRGLYSSSCIHFIIFDYLGLCRSSFQIPLYEKLRVFSMPQNNRQSVFASEDDNHIISHQNRVSSDEFLEVKKYYPGDDHRKLNWKIYAHTGELFIRKGEETPPPESSLCFVLNTGKSSLIKSEYSMDVFDKLLELLSYIIETYINKGFLIHLAVNNETELRYFSPGQVKDLHKFLSGLYPQEDSSFPDIADLNKKQLLVFTLPGTKNLDTLLASFKGAKSISIFFKELAFNKRTVPSFTYKQILFFNQGPFENQSPLTGILTNEDVRFQLNQEMLLIKNKIRRIKDVRSF